ncbi:YdeI family protein [Chitinophaga sp. Hz27]|uniref:YdeI/OmpD-associated family protein n=1 Tax=Chitinophaga sp. Hz27 TaxID=3347169 RepID=UPI0035E0C34B
MNPKVDFFFDEATQWQEEYVLLRKIVLECKLTEELKWGCPCYTYEDGNVVLIHGFKEYCALLFFKGALMKDPEGILIQQSKNVQAGRQARFTNAKEIQQLKKTLKAYIQEAKDIEKAGLKVAMKKTEDYDVPEEFQQYLDKDAELRRAFEALTPGRQRAYLFFFGQPKTSKTREARVEKSIGAILDGKGLND